MMPNAENSQFLRTVASGWWRVLIWGILTVVLGILLISTPAITAVWMFTLLGAYFVVGGIFDIVGAVMDRVGDWGWQLLLGILYVVAGLAVLQAPVLATVVSVQLLYFFIAFSAVVGGIIKIVQALMAIGRVGFWGVLGVLLLGLLQFVIGVFLLENPISGALTLVPTMGIFAVASGIVAILASFRIRSLA